MRTLKLLSLLALAAMLVAGNTLYVGQEEPVVYSWIINHGAVTAGFSNCHPTVSTAADTSPLVSCMVPIGRTLVLEAFAVTATDALSAGSEQCKVILETNSDGTATTATEVASTLINVGQVNDNAAGVCDSGIVIIDSRGEGCTRTVDGSDTNASISSGGFWRVSVQTGTDTDGDSCGGACVCTALGSVGISVIARLQ